MDFKTHEIPSHNQICIIVPVFNEASRLKVDYWNELSIFPQIQILFVNDGSTDKTLEILRTISASNKFQILEISKNVGKAEAVRLGWKSAISNLNRYDFIGFLDADGAFNVKEIINILGLLRRDIQLTCDENTCRVNSLWSSRVALAGREIKRSAARHYLHRILMTITLFGLKGCPYDTQSGFKIWHNCEASRKLFENNFKTKWLFDIELWFRMQSSYSQVSIFEYPLMNWKEVSQSKINLKQFLVIFNDICKIWKIRIRKSINEEGPTSSA